MVADLFEAQADPLIGRTLDGRYEVLGRLGVGGVGVVYRGRQAHLGRFVAIKVLNPDLAAIPEWRQRFEREARALSVLAHPNVVSVTDSGIDRGVPYLVMELLQGKTLADLIREGPLPLGRALDIARQTLRGLAFAHGNGIVHRDLKPANVFLQALPDQADHVRLLDFGMVKFLEGAGSRAMAETLTHVGVVIGTPAYMSPEQAKGSPMDARTDVYAAGALLFELLAGRRPFLADSPEGYMGAHLTQPVPSLETVRPGLAAAPSFQAVIKRAMAKKQEARFKDAGEMLAALEAVIAKLPASAMSHPRAKERKKPTTPDARVTSPSGSRFWRRAIILLVTFAAGIAAVATYLRRDTATRIETAALPAAPPAKPALPAATPPKPAPPAETPAKPALPAAPSPTVALPAETPPKSALPAEVPPKPAQPAEPPAKPALPAETPSTVAVAAPPPTLAQPSPPPPVAPKPVPPTAPPPEAPAPAESAKEPESGSAARDPWREPVPRALQPIRDRLNRGLHMSQRALLPAYTFSHQNPGDPRPWLLLGRAYAQLDWFSDSVDRYLQAHRVDSTCRGDPQMLADLLKGAAHPVAGRVAARAIRDIYGAEAIPALDQAIERRAGAREATARLTRLRASLPH